MKKVVSDVKLTFFFFKLGIFFTAIFSFSFINLISQTINTIKAVLNGSYD